MFLHKLLTDDEYDFQAQSFTTPSRSRSGAVFEGSESPRILREFESTFDTSKIRGKLSNDRKEAQALFSELSKAVRTTSKKR